MPFISELFSLRSLFAYTLRRTSRVRTRLPTAHAIPKSLYSDLGPMSNIIQKNHPGSEQNHGSHRNDRPNESWTKIKA